MLSLRNSQNPVANNKTVVLGGLPVRTNLRAGIAWDDIDDQVKSLFDKVSNAVSDTVSNITGSTSSTTPSA